MPKDVELGEGYSGDALLAAFPGEYRDAAQESRSFDTTDWGRQSPGAVSGRPRMVNPPVSVRSDPDQGRQLMLQNIPGVGQVAAPAMGAVIPVEHEMAGAPNMGAVLPVEHQMADWRGTAFAGMGGITSAFIGWFKKDELNKLTAAMNKVQDAGVKGEQMIRGILKGDQEREAAEASVKGQFPPMLSLFPPIPNPYFFIAAAPLARAKNATRTAVELLARSYVNFSVTLPMLGQMESAFLSSGLTNDAEVVRYAKKAITRFQSAIDYQLRPAHAELFNETQAKIYSQFTRYLQSYGLSLTSYEDERFWYLLSQAGKAVVPNPVGGLDIPPPGSAGAAGMGNLGVVITGTVVAIISTILWVVGVIGALLLINSIVDKLTAASRGTVDMATAAQKRATMRLQETAKANEADRAAVAEGSMTQAEADSRLKARTAEVERENERDVKETGKAAEKAAESASEAAPGFGKLFTGILLPVGLTIGAVMLIPKIIPGL